MSELVTKDDLTLLRGEIAQTRTQLKSEINGAEARMNARLAELETRIVRWFVVGWGGTIGIVALLLSRLGK